MPDLRFENWDRELETGLPDSRLSYANRHKNMVRAGRLELEKVFCASCGGPGGAVTPEWCAHIFFICDDCARKLGPPPGLVEVPEHLVRGQD